MYGVKSMWRFMAAGCNYSVYVDLYNKHTFHLGLNIPHLKVYINVILYVSIHTCTQPRWNINCALRCPETNH